ncbi:MAG: ubiquinone/menaquinone biosynthesis methyltransferase [Anaerolineae bacterium]|nr:ubiquinone/menaquinone biosynthesis methyltransferase [Anaerolineae bacterium]MDQ7036237.1 ubiquinone/menaquinone biosynthesis methyltransferase [Anaerolineae bacterium]
MAHLTGKERSDYVQNMFGRIAERYNLLNRVMTFGQDMRWRRFVVQQANLPQNGSLLDLATGTGDIAFEAKESHPNAKVVGADFALPMMLVGQDEPRGNTITWSAADALNLPFPDNSFDAVVSGYLVRNVIDIPRTLSEQLRVLKDGGRIVILDTSPPPNNILKPFIQIHLNYIIPIMGRIIGGEAAVDAYTYLPKSTQAFKTADELVGLMQNAGYINVDYKKFMFGTMAIHWGEKPRH